MELNRKERRAIQHGRAFNPSRVVHQIRPTFKCVGGAEQADAWAEYVDLCEGDWSRDCLWDFEFDFYNGVGE